MFPYHYSVCKILVDERQRELIAQARLAKQLAEINRQKVKPVTNWSVTIFIKSWLKSFTEPKLVTQPEINPPNCQTQTDCQVC